MSVLIVDKHGNPTTLSDTNTTAPTDTVLKRYPGLSVVEGMHKAQDEGIVRVVQNNGVLTEKGRELLSSQKKGTCYNCRDGESTSGKDQMNLDETNDICPKCGGFVVDINEPPPSAWSQIVKPPVWRCQDCGWDPHADGEEPGPAIEEEEGLTTCVNCHGTFPPNEMMDKSSAWRGRCIYCHSGMH